MYKFFALLPGLLTMTLSSVCLAVVPISGTLVSSINFGSAVQGDGAVTIPPGVSENAQNGSILVQGDPNTAYSIILPVGAVPMTTGAGGVTETINISGFNSNPPAGANGLLDATGKQTLFLGAQRGALLVNQAVGAYSANFVITLSY